MTLSIITCGAHFVIDYFMISRFGINGAVIAGMTVYSISGIAYWVYLKSKSGGKDVLHY